ncbi:polyamine aminopropyltransferase [Thiohalophilus thiocyanatoxydans]|uniref:Spermidine synthase n=1 Tax=Thiohalophilus thiocyanatoxydans TaxID=381308 RepID=A0A4R8IGV8_9GAMM|nr:spermidine synthase [Thiohalophilus thiocyanatoxydans]TDX99293.1 hypothetical protein EDC23_2503 [Thiohalophilus thiocyanatoxydans]
MLFEELDYRPTPIGELSLRRRHDLMLDTEVYEIKLGEDFLMTSLFTASEIALANLALAELAGGALEVVVGGLGLGYTSRAVLEHDTVGELLNVEALEPVLDWHRQGLLPNGPGLCADPRNRFVQGDFFALVGSEAGLDPEQPGRQFDAILLDIDHAPDHHLDTRHDAFYESAGLQALARHLRPGGVFGLWSNELPDTNFTDRLAWVFGGARAEPVTFYNPYQDREFTQCVYLARR